MRATKSEINLIKIFINDLVSNQKENLEKVNENHEIK